MARSEASSRKAVSKSDTPCRKKKSRDLSFRFLLFLKERRRRDLNPCAAINDLLPFQGSPFGQLGYFSE